MAENSGIKLVTYQDTPLQAAFLEWCKLHPYSRIMELKIHEGVPLEASIRTEDGFALETIRFDKIAKEVGLI